MKFGLEWRSQAQRSSGWSSVRNVEFIGERELAQYFMKNYYRIMLGAKSLYADECFRGNFIGGDFDIDVDLSGKLSENWRDFNHDFIPFLLAKFPEKSKVAAGLACGALHTIAKGIKLGDFVLCPDGKGCYRVGEITEDYSFHPGEILPHRRGVHWLNVR